MISILNHTSTLAGIAATVIGLRWWMARPNQVQREINALDINPIDKAAALDCFDRAYLADRSGWFYDLSAPLVMLFVLPFVSRDANELPERFRPWDNNVSMNGDGYGWQDAGGNWHDARVIPPPDGAKLVSHGDPAYGGDCYYARGHHPRSFWARYIWLGWRNRASRHALDVGEAVTEPIEVISGSTDINRRGPYGHYLLRSGSTYHYQSIRPWGRWALIRHYGFKLGIVRNNPREGSVAMAVAIGRSLKRIPG